ncbi:hypothetical protein CEXT_689121 [Caerostris extrusa]|uniref:Uncharacterized protein n=1 Tax=Caerostris extrusa TaxID=172846 RepID=A0AAV4NM41_CAEEX|nr:hypothetical protein CEXT_689121 [Caerostris extrusa]
MSMTNQNGIRIRSPASSRVSGGGGWKKVNFLDKIGHLGNASNRDLGRPPEDIGLWCVQWTQEQCSSIEVVVLL